MASIFNFLGTGESGKSTFIKQMKIIHGQGFNQEDQLMYRQIIKKNVVSSMQNMVAAMDMLFIRYENEVRISRPTRTLLSYFYIYIYIAHLDAIYFILILNCIYKVLPCFNG
jgi:hypothetical protein